ncbi:MAG: response regulator transcription factor [Lachnospiraceae bacterium]|nr:response regulator transcription factor [Lachnospiraceae bacterium]
MTEKHTILIADDDDEIREVIRILLGNEGYAVLEAVNGKEAVAKMDETVSLVILDVMMPVSSGINACLEIRKKYVTPILFLTAKSSDTDKVAGFSAGGDDYLIKPFSYSELLSRVKALIRRFQIYNQAGDNSPKVLMSSAPRNIYFHDIQIDTETKQTFKNEEEIILTEIEYQILFLLAANRKKIFSVKDIYENVWKEDYLVSSNNTVNVHIRNLRKKLEDGEQPNRIIINIWGRGYRID